MLFRNHLAGLLLSLLFLPFVRATYHLEDDSTFEIKFTGNISTSNIHNHKASVVCAVYPILMNPLKASQFNLSILDGNLCTHLLVYGFKVDETTGEISEYEDNFPKYFMENWVKEFKVLRQKYPWLKILMRTGLNNDLGRITNNENATKVFYETMFNKLRSFNFDGAIVDFVGTFTEFNDFACGLSEKIKKHNYIFGTAIFPIKRAIQSLNVFQLQRCVDLMYMDFSFELVNQTNFRSRLDWLYDGDELGIRSVLTHLIEVDNFKPSKLIVEVSVYGIGYVLLGDNLTLPSCCGPEAPATTFNFGPYQRPFLKQGDVCDLFKNGNKWYYFRAETGDPFLTDLKIWIGFDDKISLENRIRYYSKLGIGVGIFSPWEDDTNQKCGPTDITQPFSRSVNYFLSVHARVQSPPRDVNTNWITAITEVEATLQNEFIDNITAAGTEWIPEFRALKMKHPWLKLLIGFIGDNLSSLLLQDNRSVSILIRTVYSLLSESKFDGVIFPSGTLEAHYIQNFICVASSGLRRSGHIIGIYLKYEVHEYGRDPNFLIVEKCVDFFYMDPYFINRKNTRLLFPLKERYRGNVIGIVPSANYFLEKGVPHHKLVVALNPQGLQYELRRDDTSFPECCLLNAPANWKHGGRSDTKSATLSISEVCDNLSNGRLWHKFRTEFGDPFITDGISWISYDDRESIKAKMSFIISSGVGVAMAIAEDNTNNKCGATNIPNPLTRSINYFLHEDGSVKARPATFDNNTWELKSLILSTLNDKDMCLAEMESNFTSDLTVPAPMSRDRNGCSTSKHGIFGLYSPICSNPQDPFCQESICHMACEADALDANLTDDIHCVRQLMEKDSDVIPLSMSYCLANPFNDNHRNYDECKLRKEKNTQGNSNFLIAVLGSIALVSGITVSLFIRLLRKKRDVLNSEEIELFLGGNSLENDFMSRAYDDKYETSSDSYSIDKTVLLGSGVFGMVYKAMVQNTPAAVKTLKPFADKQYLICLLSEIKIMIYLEKHENVVGFIGADTHLLKKGILYVFLEYCEMGSLQNHLQKNREIFGTEITQRDLVQWSYQISMGMSHLANKNVIHGDLSAKNVLLTDELVAKITDFGLSRQLYTSTEYIKQGKKPLPWRWMSIEALRDLQFSIESDVWAFGVTMWEIFSLGSLPYPCINYSTEFIEQLILGLRPLKPETADKYVFDSIITKTWDVRKESRPSFVELSRLLQGVLQKDLDDDYTVL